VFSRVQVRPAILARLVLLDGHAVRLGEGILANTGDLP
jgi:hypothetical protein